MKMKHCFFLIGILLFNIPTLMSAEKVISPVRLCNHIFVNLSPVSEKGDFTANATIKYPEKWSPLPFKPVVTFKTESESGKMLSKRKTKVGEQVKLIIPPKGNAILFIEVTDGNISVIGQRTIVFQNGVPLNAVSDDSTPIVITMPAICNFARCRNTTHQVMQIRSKVIANLIQNYNVIVLTRQNSMSLANEQNIHAVSNLNEKTTSSLAIPGADFAITGYFNIARKTPGHSRNVDLGCTLLISDLQDKSNTSYKKIDFIPNDAKLFAGNITQRIVKELKLKPKKQEKGQFCQKFDETWAVMPITRLESERAMNSIADKNLALEIELALQNTNRVKRIVDHSEIDKVLSELKLSSFQVSSNDYSIDVASIIGADKLIMGTVGQRFNWQKGLRVDLFLVDAKTAITLSAVSAMSDTNNLSDVVKKLVPDLLNQPYTKNKLENCNDFQLKKETALYEEIFYSLGSTLISKKHIAILATSFAETIYLLNSNDLPKRYKLAESLMKRVLPGNYSIKKKQEIAKLIEKILRPIPVTKTMPYSLLYQASAFNMASIRIDDAIRLVQRHLKEHPNINPGYANGILGECYYQKKNYQKAIEYGEKGGRNNQANRLLVKLYRLQGDRRNDAKELKCLKSLNVKKLTLSYDVCRRLELTRKIEGDEAALTYFKYLSSWTKVRPEILLEVAKANLGLGHKKKAAAIISGIANKHALKRSQVKNPQKKQVLKKAIFQLKKELEDYIEPWKRFADVVSIPKNLKLYLRPMGSPDMTLLENAVPLIENYSGCRVEILPLLSMPSDPYCYKKGRGQYHSYNIQQRLKRLIPPPVDGISIAEITDKSIYCRRLRYIYSSPYYGSYLISYYPWYSVGNSYVMTELIAKSACGALKTSARLRSCYQPLCMNSSDGTVTGIKYKKFLLCPDCSEKLSKIASSMIYASFQSRYKRRPPLRRPDKQEWEKRYQAAIQHTLNKGKKETAEKSESNKKYQASIQMKGEPAKGLLCQYYEIDDKTKKSTNCLKKLVPKETDISETFSLKKAKRKEWFGFVFNGLIKIPVDGSYQFYLSSNDGSNLWIDDKEIINNDGLHAVQTKSESIALKAGFHKIKLMYMQGKGESFLTLYYRGPQTLGQLVPGNALFHIEQQENQKNSKLK